MRHSWADIQTAIMQRRMYDAPLIRRMVDTRDHYNGDVTIPLVNVQDQPEMNVLMPFLVADGIEGTAMRAAGPMPTIHTPAVDESKQTGMNSQEYARTRRRVFYARWHRARLPVTLGRAFRQLCGYGTFGLTVTPNFQKGGANIEFRDALGAYPSVRAPEDVSDPENVGFVYGKSPDFVRAFYPQSRQLIDTWMAAHSNERLWDMVEWIDDTDIVIGLLGPRSLYAVDTATSQSATTMAMTAGMELNRYPNRAGMVPAVVPRRVTLDRIAGQMEKIIPMEEWSAKLMALDFVAAERGVFPDTVVIGDEGRTPVIVGNRGWRGGRTGDVNLLQNVKGVQNLQMAPGPMTAQTLDRIERNARISSGNTPFYGSETTGSLRTGRAIDALGGFSIDPRIAELQQIMGYALETVNRAICAVEKGYFAEAKYTVFSGWSTDIGQVQYSPGKHFETDDNIVIYPLLGADASQITVAVAQLNGARLISRHSARVMHPWIQDAEQEDQMSVKEAVADATLSGFEQQLVAGQMSWQAAAEFYQLLDQGKPWDQVIIEVHNNEQQRQAAQVAAQQAQQAGGPQNPLANGGASTMPGLGGGPQPTASVPPPEQGVVNAASMVRALHAGANASRPRGPGPAPVPVGAQ